MYLYPRLTLSAAAEISKSKSVLDTLMLRQTHDGNKFIVDDSALYAPTGGHRVDSQHLKTLRKLVRECADNLGFPEQPDVQTRQTFDTQCSIILFQNMNLTPSEASSLGVWSHMTCILLPDIVRWRFGGDATSEDRFIGSARGLRRNTFGRLWWRAYLLHEPAWTDDQFYLLSQFGEDDLVQITERPSLAGSPLLAKQVLLSFLEISQGLKQSTADTQIRDRALLRDVVKRIRRLLPIVVFEALDPQTLKGLIDDLFVKSVESLQQV